MNLPRRRASGGMTLVEALVALTVLALVLLLGLTAAVLAQRGGQRLAAQQQGLRALEAVVESLHSGALVLSSGPPIWISAPPPGLTENLALTLKVEPTETAGLYRVEVVANFKGSHPPPPQRLDTVVWRAAGTEGDL